MPKGLFVYFGPPGAGKTTEALSAHQKSLYIASAPNNAHFYKELVKAAARNGAGPFTLGLPTQELVIDQYAVILGGRTATTLDPKTNMPRPVPQRDTLMTYTCMALRKAFTAFQAGEPPPWNYVIYDEMGTFLNRVFAELAPTVLTKDGKPNLLGAFGQMGDWTANLTNLLRQLLTVNVGVVFIAHDQEPDPSSDKKGGPKFTSQAIMRQICSDADGVLMRALEDPPLDIDHPTVKRPAARVWRAHGSQHWLSKLRGLPDSKFDEIRSLALRDILPLAGFDP